MTLRAAYERLDATALAARVVAGDVDADGLLDIALDRLARIEPALRAIAFLDEGVARRRIAAGLPDGPLRGVPFLLKDLGAEAVDFPSSAGSRLLRGTRHPRDSSLVARLNATGLVSFGRTTCPEGGVGAVTEAALYGAPTRNPWNLERSPGGSSGGAAALVAAGVLPAAHGSDGGGSIRIPASCCGLVGFKATRARLPDGPYAGEGWAGMAIDGFLTRSVRDSALLLDACAGPDPGAPYRAPPMPASYAEALARSPRRLRIAVAEGTLDGAPIDASVSAGVRETADLLAGLGHEIVRASPVPGIEPMMRAWTDIVACGTAHWIEAKLAKAGRELRDDDVEPVARSAREYARTLSGVDYLSAVEAVHAFGRSMAGWFDGDGRPVDVLLSATLAEPPARIGRFDHSRDDYVDYRLGPDGVFAHSPFTAVFNASGQPAMSLPLHWTSDGLPVGLHFAAPFGDDAVLMALAGELEAARPWFERRPPIPRGGAAIPVHGVMTPRHGTAT